MLRHCLQKKVKQTLNELPKNLDETYARILKNIAQMASSDDVIRLLQCLSVAIRRLALLIPPLTRHVTVPDGPCLIT